MKENDYYANYRTKEVQYAVLYHDFQNWGPPVQPPWHLDEPPQEKVTEPEDVVDADKIED